ncbi:MAG: hypothetical protein JWO31_218 [Phycisphaerales bacterium]|nr:hypothetical protein [Phycisphaerales bacterium]
MSVAPLPASAPPPPPAAGVTEDFVFRLSVRQYHDMIRQGILVDGDPVELLEGMLVVKMSKNPLHSKSTGRVQSHLNAVLPGGYYARVQEPVTLADGEPEPDVAVVRGTDDEYTDCHPGPADAPLVVEVADSSLARDRTLKLRGYARAGVLVYWIVNLIERQVEVYEQPDPASAAYARRRVYTPGQRIPVRVDGGDVGDLAIDELLP